MCYYFEPIRAAIAQPFSTRMPKDRVCKRLKQSNGEICNVKYQVQVDNNLSDEEMLAQLKKKRVKELKGILNDRGVKCEGCLEKDDFIKKIMATNGETDLDTVHIFCTVLAEADAPRGNTSRVAFSRVTVSGPGRGKQSREKRRSTAPTARVLQ